MASKTNRIERPRTRKRTERIYEQTKLVRGSPDDPNTTEEAHITKSRLPSEPPFVKMYIEDLGALMKLGEAPTSFLNTLLHHLDYDGFICLSTGTRRRLAQALGITDQTFRNYLSELRQKDIIRRAGGGDYVINPTLFARGDWSYIAKLREQYQRGLELRITYTADGQRYIEGVPRSKDDQQMSLFENEKSSVFESAQERYEAYRNDDPKTPDDLDGQLDRIQDMIFKDAAE